MPTFYKKKKIPFKKNILTICKCKIIYIYNIIFFLSYKYIFIYLKIMKYIYINN